MQKTRITTVSSTRARSICDILGVTTPVRLRDATIATMPLNAKSPIDQVPARLFRSAAGRRYAGIPETSSSENILNQTDHHPKPRQTKSVSPVVLRDPTAQERRHQSPRVDTHVKDRESGISTRVRRRIQQPNNCADIRF